jgi:predicted O-methyltransferase YrrM
LDQTTLFIASRRRSAAQPWITRDAIGLLATMLRRTDQGLEFGSGGSTEWLAKHVGSVISVEAFARWYDALAERLTAAHIDNVSLEFVSADALGYESEAHREAYVNTRPDLAAGSLDFVFVDGEYRDHAALRGVELLKPGGLLILDNANSYLPAPSRTPWRVARPASAKWTEFLAQVLDWRLIWTTNGSWDTAIWVKA